MRARIALAFALLGSAAVADQFDDLVAQLAEQDYEKRRTAEEALQGMVAAKDLARLEGKLGDNYLINSCVIRIIEGVGGDPARDVLRRILRGANVTNALYAYYSLSRMKDEASNDYVLGLLSDPAVPDDRKTTFINALYSIPNERAVPILRTILATARNEYLRTRAIGLLADRKDTASLEVLRGILADEKEAEAVRASAGVALVRLGDATGEALVRAMLAAGKVPYMELLQLLSGLDTKERAEPYFDPLREHLAQAKEKHVRVAIIDFLARMGDQKLLDRIEALFDDPEEEVAEAAARAVLTLGRSPEQMKKYLVDPAARLRFQVEVAGALLLIDDFDGLGVLVEAAGSDDPIVRRSATEKLGLARIDEAIEPLIARLADADPTVRGSAAAALRVSFDSLVPYSRFDWDRLAYDTAKSDAARDAQAIQAVGDWWRRNRDPK